MARRTRRPRKRPRKRRRTQKGGDHVMGSDGKALTHEPPDVPAALSAADQAAATNTGATNAAADLDTNAAADLDPDFVPDPKAIVEVENVVDDGIEKTGGGKNKKKNKKGGKRPLNAYFKLMLAAKARGDPSFVYNDNTYYGRKNGRLGMIDSKSKSKSKSASKPKKRRKTKRAKGTKKRKSKRKRKCRNTKGKFKKC